MVSLFEFLKKVDDKISLFLKDKDFASIMIGLLLGFVLGVVVCWVF